MGATLCPPGAAHQYRLACAIGRSSRLPARLRVVTNVTRQPCHGGGTFGVWVRNRGASVKTTGKIILLGGGVCGLAAGMLLRRDGHEVTVLERDPAPVPSSPHEAWEHWTRCGVTHFRQPHYLQSRGRIMLEEELPDVVIALEGAGGLRFDPLCLMPPSITDRTPREGDERFKTITARRPVIEHVLSRAADDESGLVMYRGVRVR